MEEIQDDQLQNMGPKRGSFEAVVDILKGKDKLQQARETLREDFLAKSSKAAQRSKREQVLAR